jgi:beta-lactamase regulating signal transducer with metallopeptidase domain
VNSAYLLRLALLCCASFLLSYVAAATFVAVLAPAALRVAAEMKPRAAARFLYAMRMLPLIVSVLATIGLCIPSYLWLEPQGTPEKIGFACLFAALLSAALWCVSLTRAAASILHSRRWTRALPKSHRAIRMAGESCHVSLIEVEAPLLGLTGLFRSQVVLSRGVQRALSAEQLDAALRHENVHRTAHDNFKRLLLLLAPAIWPFSRALVALDRDWARLSEWAADDEATNGDVRMRLELAAALVCVAQLGNALRQPLLCASLVADDRDLAARVLRLIEGQATSPPKSPWYAPGLAISAALLTVCSATAAVLRPTTLYAVHQLLEHLLR